jgi:hypothetical protein
MSDIMSDSASGKVKHIVQHDDFSYIVVDTTEYEGELETHPAIVNYPHFFKIVDGVIPETHSTLYFQDGEKA